MRRYPFFDEYYEVLDYFDNLYCKNKEDGVKFISFKINDFIEIRNKLCLTRTSLEDLIVKHSRLSKVVHIDKNKSNCIKKNKKRMSRGDRNLRFNLNKKRHKTIAVYPKFKNVIQVFDTKSRKYSNERRNSFKLIKKGVLKHVNVQTNFKIDNFKRQIDILRKEISKIENHIHFFLNEYPIIENKFKKIEFIKKM